MSLNDGIALVLLLAGGFFFLAGTVGLLRFPDVYTRLHALTKADNLGLGLVAAGLVVQAPSWAAALKLLLIWLLVLLASTVSCHLIARSALWLGIPPEGRP
jgi:multicomponent Na+:H+ antiporter subunit G